MMSLVRRWWMPALGMGLFVLAAWLTPAIWIRLDGWVQNQRDAVWERFETLVGQKVVYDRIAPSVLAALDFQNVRLLADDGRPVLTAASIRLSLDWGLLLQGKVSEALRKVQVINATLNIDERRDRALLDHWASFIRSGGGTAFGFEVEGFNLKARWTDGARAVSLDRGFVVLTPRDGQWGIRFRGALGWDEPSSGRWARLSVRGDLRSDPSFQNWSLRTEASLVATSWFDLDPVTLQVTVSPEEVTVAKVADRIPFDLQAVWDRGADRWKFKGAAEGFQPSRLVHLKGQRLWSGLADGTISGRFAFQLGGDFSFEGRGDWPAGSWPAPFNADPVSASGAVSTEGGVYHFDRFHLEAPLLSLGFDGVLDRGLAFPEGTLQMDRVSIPGVGGAQGTWDLARAGTKITFFGRQVKWNDLTTEGATGWLEREGDSWNFQLDGPLGGTPDGHFSATGSFNTKALGVLARVKAASVPLAILEPEIRVHAPGFAFPAMARSLVAETEASVVWSPNGWEVNDATFDVKDPERPARRLEGTLAWKNHTAEVVVRSLTWDGMRASARGTARFQDDGPVELTLSGRLWDRSVDLVGRWVPSDKTLAFSGSPGVSGNVHENDSGVWLAELSLAPWEIVPGWRVGFQARGTLEGQKWSVTADRLELSGRYPWNQESFSATTRLVADFATLRFEGLVLADAHGRLVGSATSSWSADWSRPWTGRALLSTPDTNRETLAVDWVGNAVDRWHFGTQVGGLDVTRVPGLGIQGRLALTGAADWQGADAAWTAQAALSEARWGDSPLGFRASFAGTSRRISVKNANLSVNSLRITDGSAELDAGSRTWRAVSGVGIRFGAGDWLSRWTASGSWKADDQAFRSVFTLKTQDNTWSRTAFPDAGLTGHWGSDGWQVTLGSGELVADGLPDGTFHLRAKSPFPIKAEADGVWKGATFSASVRGFQADLGLVKDFVNSPLFSVSKGIASGDFTLEGVPTDPEVSGRLVIRGMTMESSFVRQTMGPVDVPVVFDGHQVRFDPVNWGPSGQTWLVSGVARLDHLVPEEFQFAVQTDALSVVPVSYQYTGLSVAGGISGLLLVKGTPLAVTLGGRLVLQDTTITLKQTQPSSSPGLGFNVDLTLITGRKVEFLWPNESLPLLRAVTAAGQILTVKANDVASTWSVVGKMAIRTGEINYLNRTFVVKEGELGFQENQAGFDPRISVRAEYKVRETSGTVVVNLRADGTLNKFSPRFDATPYQSPEELQRLVGTTLALPTDYTKATNMDTALSLASDVGTSFLLTPFEETVKKNFQLDLFTVKTEILKKSLLSRNGPLEASDYLDNTRLFFGKYIGDDLFLQGTLAFRQDGSVATQVSPKMVVEPEFQMEFQTPFFLLNWTLLPLHPETLFVTDNTVTFRWNWSY